MANTVTYNFDDSFYDPGMDPMRAEEMDALPEADKIDQVTIDFSDANKIIMAVENDLGDIKLYSPEEFQEKYPLQTEEVIAGIKKNDASAGFNSAAGHISQNNLSGVLNELYGENDQSSVNFDSDITLVSTATINAPNM